MYGINKERIEIEINFDIIGIIEVKVMIKILFEVLKIVEVSFFYDGIFLNFRINIRGIFNNYSLESNFEIFYFMRIIGGKINLVMIFLIVKFIELVINYEGLLDSFEIYIEIIYN